ncbi:hypothetical protein ACIRBX_12575 [Kitasatospora sp. NPDC096147]|uniref:hypothetical protein n=1 Tax=Kitasatospora sp. NPDC096147 TaxID=3364093 RepID=UPI0037FD7E0C
MPAEVEAIDAARVGEGVGGEAQVGAPVDRDGQQVPAVATPGAVLAVVPVPVAVPDV